MLSKTQGRYGTTYNLKRPDSPHATERLAELERHFFKSCCDAPELDFKPRANLQKHFCKFNTPESHGPLPMPSARTRADQDYQRNCANQPHLPC